MPQHREIASWSHPEQHEAATCRRTIPSGIDLDEPEAPRRRSGRECDGGSGFSRAPMLRCAADPFEVGDAKQASLSSVQLPGSVETGHVVKAPIHEAIYPFVVSKAVSVPVVGFVDVPLLSLAWRMGSAVVISEPVQTQSAA